MKKYTIILLLGLLSILFFVFYCQSPATDNKLTIFVSNDPNMDNPYSITLINPNKFTGQAKTNLEMTFNESIFATNYFINNVTSNTINNFKI